MAITLKFDPNQGFQRDAVRATVDALDGLPNLPVSDTLSLEVVPNLPIGWSLDETLLAENVALVQERHGIAREDLLRGLEVDEGLVLDAAGSDSWRYPSFTVEMETGTGKTYVYLRTIHELRDKYGMRKFVIVVPSVAIYEGVLKNLRITRGHFAALYGNPTVEVIAYEGAKLSALRHFATSTSICVMVMTLASFNSKNNVIFRASEDLPGERLPYEYIQETRPILILDEPQNMSSDRSKAALRALKPLFALRYSATHRETPNLIYRLTPFDAYRLHLVKAIQVDAVTERENANLGYLALDKIEQRAGRWVADVRARVNDGGQARVGTVPLHQGQDLATRAIREDYADGYVVEEINAAEGYVEFENGERLQVNEGIAPTRPAVFRAQIEATVRAHLERQRELRDQGIKVLSLFFIDRVANYVDRDGLIRRIFDDVFETLKGDYPHFARWRAEQVRDAYFAQRKKKGADEEEAFDATDRTKAEREAQARAFQLIMRDKERLLSLDEPVSFIFAHSALKEGWDNPNVFQICTLNQTQSEMKKRQEIGRGLRLAVNQNGDRVFDDEVNVLTVVANESYDGFCRELQQEYVEAGQAAPPRPTRAGGAKAQRNDALFYDKAFRDFWGHLAQKAQYEINIDTKEVIALALERMHNDRKDFYQLRPVIAVEHGQFVMTEFRIRLLGVHGKRAHLRIEAESTDGTKKSWEADSLKVRDKLERLCEDERLRDYQLAEVGQQDGVAVVTFTNGETLYEGTEARFQTEAGQAITTRTRIAPDTTYPVPNLLDRAARETGLTRRTLLTIFEGLADDRRQMLLKNPEGFIGWFTSYVRGALADHIVANLRFTLVGGGEGVDLAKLFPEVVSHPQKELVPAGRPGLYDQMQVDSEVEERFVAQRLRSDDRVICYFKFPPRFTIPLPRLLGNYNPDWGILRYAQDEQIVLELVRETKGAMDPARLRFPHEQRKVRAAHDYFAQLGVDYRVVTDEIADWWEQDPQQHRFDGERA